MMFYTGIDIAKLNHFASVISNESEVLIEPFQFSNNSDGFQLLISVLFFLKECRHTTNEPICC